MRSRLAKARNRLILATMTAILVLSILPGLNSASGSPGYVWYINFADNNPYFVARSPYSGSFSVNSAFWYNIPVLGGSYLFNTSQIPGLSQGNYGSGYMYTSANLINFTFDLLFCPLYKPGYNVFDPQVIFSISDFISVWLTGCTTATPTLHVQLKVKGGMAGIGGVVAQFAGQITANSWHDLIVTYSNVSSKYYAYLDYKNWGSGTPQLTGNKYWWAASGSDRRTLMMAGKTPNSMMYYGYVCHAFLSDTFTTGGSITTTMMWYHFDEGYGTSAIDSSQSGYDMTVRSAGPAQWSPYGRYGYCISVLNSYTPYGTNLAVNSSTSPSLTDKYTTAFWFNIASWPATTVVGLELVHLKPFIIKLFTNPNNNSASLILVCGGSTLYSKSCPAALNTWYYVYSKYDGSWLTLTWLTQSMTVKDNKTLSKSGILSEQAQYAAAYKWGFCSDPLSYATPMGILFDEFKLVHNTLGPWELNTSFIGVPSNSSWQGISVSDQYWLKAQIQPSIVVCNPTGSTTLYVNASGNWSVKFAQADLFSYFTFSGFDVAFLNIYYGIVSLPLTFTKTTNSTARDYNYSLIVLNRNNAGAGPDDSLTLIFTLRILSNETNEWPNQSQLITQWANITLKNNPLSLKWSSWPSGKIIVWSEGWVRSASAYGGPLALTFGDLVPANSRYQEAHDRILSYVSKVWYIPANYNLTYIHEWFEIRYGTDEVLAQYGNMTWYHYYHIADANSPDQGYVTKIATINFYSYFVGGRLWVTVSQSTVAGKPGEDYHLALHIYSKPASQVYWEITQGGLLGYEATYVKWTGNPRQYLTNYSADLTITIPEAVGPRVITIRAYDVKNPGLTNSTTLTVINTSPRSFSVKLIPDVLYVSWLKYPSTGYNVKVFIDCNVSHHFYLTVLNEDPYLYSISVEYPQDVGTGPHLTADSVVRIVAPGIVYNGTYFIEYEAYTGPDEGSLYASATLTLKISDSYYPIPGRNQTSGNQTNPPLPPPSGDNNWNNNWSSIPSNFNVPVTGIGSGAAYAWVALFATSTGLPMMAAGFLIGLIFLVALMLIIGAGTGFRAPSIMYMIPMVAMTYFNTMIGVWDIWITVIITLFAIGMASLKIMGVFE